MDVHAVLTSQYLAALAMLRQAITQCPAQLWEARDDGAPFWQIAYHALFYTQLYLHESLETFAAWPKHREEYQFSDQPQPAVQPPDQALVLEYLALCEQQVRERVAAVNLAAASGFAWLPFSKLELQIYTIRHLQQHTGELTERLSSRAARAVDWVGARA